MGDDILEALDRDMRRLGLLKTDPPYQRHSETSKAAADRIMPDAGTLRAYVLASLRLEGSATDEMLQERLQMSPNTQRPRRVELVKQGWVKDSGLKAKTKSGRLAVLWAAV